MKYYTVVKITFSRNQESQDTKWNFTFVKTKQDKNWREVCQNTGSSINNKKEKYQKNQYMFFKR